MSGGGTETPVGCEAAPGGGSKKRDSLGTAGSAHLIIKDLGEIHSRLLDHRPVIQGETRYFVKEFECKQLMTQSVDSNRGSRNEKKIHSDHLVASEKQHTLQWDDFLKEQPNKRAEVDEEHRKAMERLKEQYAEMEKDLAKFSTF
ncbi:biogenesis of lysosome-related organelles complex 1 subunit 5 isoform X2 [Piliocolobus tephrosceles]|uniref:biogenesis of lysosome-related organelles complex 1 subunit 5 isoform X2 n=1 Tax=Piliocolobus tephrosceles TaxID=591936 RepID=UPI000C2A6348|nr:biogenesis of lysosome-related organelles complex 1 subunit 5 isoform X2 [Piliocolobus tephrosceles]